MQKIVDYKIVSANSAPEMTERVRVLMQEGWTPYPSLTCLTTIGGTVWLYQPLARYEAGHA